MTDEALFEEPDRQAHLLSAHAKSPSASSTIYVTAFLDRGKVFKQFIPEIAWETEVWVASEPDHLIHFDGERFLGPYELTP